MKVTKISQKGIDLITSFEGFKSKAYLCPAKVWTIGFGTTRYPDGTKVKNGDPDISKQEAIEYLLNDIRSFELSVDNYTTDLINQNQFDALVSFAYNLGAGALKGSTLLQKVNSNPNDPTIKNEFLKWVKAGGKTLQGLVRRRTAEAELYFKK